MANAGDFAEIEKLIKSCDQPRGVTVQASDGRLFFLTDEEAERALIPPSTLYDAFRLVSQQRRTCEEPPTVKAVLGGCDEIWGWLESRAHNSAIWRKICLFYFDNC